ncbi:hypothetical protein [Chitinophaga sp. MM2321]|uniref:hypothetical protein n=1 Tax=Chitinophaga sp. MM2321 TaxID=3137178 RepID=UPI0032D59334
MGNKRIIKYQEFLSKAILIDQTHLINTLIKEDRHLDYFNHIYNRVKYNLSLSDGYLTATDEVLTDKIAEIQNCLKGINVKLKENLLEFDSRVLMSQRADLVSDLEKLEGAKSREREIFDWYLIPHWLSDTLISMGEVVFRSFGCNWWGVSSLLEDHCSKDEVLLELIEEIDKSGNFLNSSDET